MATFRTPDTGRRLAAYTYCLVFSALVLLFWFTCPQTSALLDHDLTYVHSEYEVRLTLVDLVADSCRCKGMLRQLKFQPVCSVSMKDLTTLCARSKIWYCIKRNCTIFTKVHLDGNALLSTCASLRM